MTDNSQALEATENSQENSQENTTPTHNFKPGQMLEMVRVRFPGHNKSFPFLVGSKKFSYGQQVVAMSDRGIAVGYVNSFIYQVAFKESMLPLRTINKVANQEDIDDYKENFRKEKNAEMLCNELIERHNLEMNITHTQLTQFGKKCVIYFNAPARVDFRNLVKDLVSSLKIRVELRQISVRDRAAAIGGIGACGRQLCCSSFLEKYGNVNIKMAKNQSLSINFSQLNGVCGQIKCCIKYEDKVYLEKRKKLPKLGSSIRCKNSDEGIVEDHMVLVEHFTMLTTRGVRKRYVAEEFDEELSSPLKLEKFEHIVDERFQVVGEDNLIKANSARFEEDILEIQNKAKGHSKQIFENLFGASSIEELLGAS
jgi:cell fate regulator YaaT (PSP1 superfamily)